MNCPSIEGIMQLVASPTMRANAGVMVSALATKIKSLPTVSAQDVKQMVLIFESLPELRCGQIAAGLLRNSSSQQIPGETLAFVANCTATLAAAEPSEREGLQGYSEVVSAAREWFKEQYASEPFKMRPVKEEEDDDDWGTSWGTSWGGASWGAHGGKKKKKEKKKGPTAAEIQKMREECMTEGVQALVDMLQLPIFSSGGASEACSTSSPSATS